MTGGCLCGAVRWASSAPPRDVHHCHCGMCRRWTGGGFATLVWFGAGELAHCGVRGTPLYLEYSARCDTVVAAGTQAVTPTHYYGVEGRLHWVDIGAGLPDGETREKW